ncbi:hypothetical protein CBS63078_3542 [Aspergillus niger]|uniref:Heat shock factor binding protein 1 n=2 Tax=Aspergillus TaxID=5052 RepID=A0A370PLM7_ASPPH|nr:uncharacterized protein BO96DRAFT_412945 [Aspergillus niger CBS 101883]KAI2829672.1 hypothetical protein CBS133816_4396 [Aspergillus niger]RDK42804.1 hypothetical protein M752DRAFT_275912 [Aspergillus phoenicis ATCC 13157]KAI2848036.1 hypothetical protein CBS11350_2977 [Aspergillus niger]KAI2863127.1 hypothetical protein CBS12448_4143 [Aspergillus niger]KAI2905555.1 hypothetical protein CBS11852_1089 [Aspergillus niger]
MSESTAEAVPPPPTTSTQNSDAQGQFSAAVDDLLDQLQHKFDGVSREMFGKLDDMARRLDELEASFTVVDGTTTSGGGGGASASQTGTGSVVGSAAGSGSPEK